MSSVALLLAPNRIATPLLPREVIATVIGLVIAGADWGDHVAGRWLPSIACRHSSAQELLIEITVRGRLESGRPRRSCKRKQRRAELARRCRETKKR